MSVIVGLSAKGAPGVSLGMWSLLHCWSRPVVGLEADLSGGSWALTHGLSWDPGLMDLAAAQSPIDAATTESCSIALSATKRVVCAPKEPVSVGRAMEWLSPRLAAWPATIDALVDVGRTNGSHPMISRADAAVLWTRTDPSGLGASAALLTALERTLRPGVVVSVVTVGDRPYSPTETVDALSELTGPRLVVRLGAALPFDPRLAAIVEGGGRQAAKVCRSWFATLADELVVATSHRPIEVAGQPAFLASLGRTARPVS